MNKVTGSVIADAATGAQRSDVKYVLLCRHGRHENGNLAKKKTLEAQAPPASGWRLPWMKRQGASPVGGRTEYPTQDVANVLREELLYGREIKLGTLLYAPTPESVATAALIRDGLAGTESAWMPKGNPFEAPGQVARILIKDLERDAGILDQPSYGLYECPQLNPALPRTQATVVNAQECIAENLEADEDSRNAVLVVGHQPQLSWLSSQLTTGYRWRQWRRLQWWSNGPIPISHGEIVCLRIENKRKFKNKWSAHLLWSIHPNDSERLADVREKVQSKLKTAELLAAVLGLAIAAVLALLLDRTRWRNLAFLDETTRRPRVYPFGWDWASFEPRTGVQFAVAMLLSALALYLMTVYAYDSLRMPPSFWSENLPDRRSNRLRRRWLPRRPPSSSAWIIYRNMMRIWGTLFVPATLLVLAAFTLLAISLLEWNATVWAWLPGIAILAIVLLWKRNFRPVLGSED